LDSASSSCVWRDNLRIKRPKNSAANTITGKMDKFIKANLGETKINSAIPIQRLMHCRIISAMVVVIVSWIWDKSADNLLFNSPTRRFAKKSIGKVMSLREESLRMAANDFSVISTKRRIRKNENIDCTKRIPRAIRPILKTLGTSQL